MNALEQLLRQDLDRLIDRLAATTREGVLPECAARRPDIVARLEEAEAQLSSARLHLLAGYAGWLRSLQECADLWALANLADDVEEPILRAA